ncbi:MAG: hypothetical protein M1837_005203 [Sclerophora amabilis]|nr:MAG: hypothetical protein M1837_005203 [Sclerophora amabilis]
MAQAKKRQGMSDPRDNHPPKIPKRAKKWRTANHRHSESGTDGRNPYAGSNVTIEAGDSGIWATCDTGREGKCIGELRDLFDRYAEVMYPQPSDEADEDGGDDDGGDIEATVQKELAEMKKPKREKAFQPARLGVQCVVFFKTRAPVEPVDLVHRICNDAATGAGLQQSRFVKRLTPTTLTAKATEKGLEEVAKTVLAPHFQKDDGKVIKVGPASLEAGSAYVSDVDDLLVAALVGSSHVVDLKNYDLLILVEVYKNVCGVAVVGSDYEALKRYNLSEIYEPTPKPIAAVQQDAPKRSPTTAARTDESDA